MTDKLFSPEAVAPINPIAFPPERQVRLLRDAELKILDSGVRAILSDVGVKFPLPLALDLFEKAGATVDRATEIVKIPSELLDKALNLAPKAYTMASRDIEERDVKIGSGRTHCATDGTGINIADMDTGEIRASTKADLAKMARVADYLSSISFFWPILSAQDKPQSVMSLHEVDASFRNTSKHVQLISCADQPQAKFAVEMAKAVAGSEERMRKRPPLSILTCAISPLTQDAGGLLAGLEFAKAGLPVGLATMPMLGGTAPGTVPSLLAMGVAELLSSVVFFQLAQPRTPVFCALFSTLMNPYNGNCMTSTNLQTLLNIAPVDIFRYYKLPVMATYGSGDSNQLNTWTFGRDISVDTIFAYMSQPDMFPGFGLMDNDTLCFPQHMLLDDYVYSTIKTLSDGLVVDEASLMVDELKQVGAGGSFMSRAKTMKSLRKQWEPSVRHQWDPTKKKFKDIMDSAREKIEWIWANHQPVPLSSEVDMELKKIILAAEKELV